MYPGRRFLLRQAYGGQVLRCACAGLLWGLSSERVIYFIFFSFIQSGFRFSGRVSSSLGSFALALLQPAIRTRMLGAK
jgi:hypothetical protein